MTFPITSNAPEGEAQWGAVDVPVEPTPAIQGPPADPALKILLEFLRAFLVSDENVLAAWQSPGVDPSTKPVASIFAYNPEEYVFRTDCLPALYLWRESGSIDWIADDWDVSTDLLKLLWVFPQNKPEDAAVPSSFVNGLVKAINIAIERGRTPSWQVPDDPDPVAQSQGSFLGTFLNAYALWAKTWRRQHVTERDLNDNVVAVYRAIEVSLIFQETWLEDITLGTEPTSAENGDDMIVTNPEGTTMVEGYLAGTPVTD